MTWMVLIFALWVWLSGMFLFAGICSDEKQEIRICYLVFAAVFFALTVYTVLLIHKGILQEYDLILGSTGARGRLISIWN